MIEIALICKDLYDVITNTIELNSKKDEINKTVNDINAIKAELNGKDEETMENIVGNLELDVQIIGLQAIWDYIYDVITTFNVYAIGKITIKYVSVNVAKIVSEMIGKKLIEKIALRFSGTILTRWYLAIIAIEGIIIGSFYGYWENNIYDKLNNMCSKLDNAIIKIKASQEWREYFE